MDGFDISTNVDSMHDRKDGHPAWINVSIHSSLTRLVFGLRQSEDESSHYLELQLHRHLQWPHQERGQRDQDELSNGIKYCDQLPAEILVQK